jgi:hypothetical protein
MPELRKSLEQLAAALNQAAADSAPLGDPPSFEVVERDGWVVLRIHTDNGGGPETSHPIVIDAEIRADDDGVAIRIPDHGLDARGWSADEALAHLEELGTSVIPSPLIGT